MLQRFYSRLHPLKAAATPAEREAIYRFRYSVLVEELKRSVGIADHTKKLIRDEQDESPHSTQLYVGTPGEITAAIRVRCFEPGKAPPNLFEDCSLDLVPGADKLGVAKVGRLLARPSLGTRLLGPSLAAGVGAVVAQNSADLVCFSCKPGLVPHYLKFGARLFGGRLVSRPEGVEVPLLLVPTDEAHLRETGSPAAGFAERYQRAPIDLAPLAPLFKRAVGSIVTTPDAVATELQKALLAGRQPPVFLQSLDRGTVERLASQGFILSVFPGGIVVREGRSERELYAVLEGTFDVSVKGTSVNALGRGDLFGEVAFFTAAGRRSATVKATSNGRLVVIRPRFLDELARRDPRAALVITQNLARILAERIDRITPK